MLFLLDFDLKYTHQNLYDTHRTVYTMYIVQYNLHTLCNIHGLQWGSPVQFKVDSIALQYNEL